MFYLFFKIIKLYVSYSFLTISYSNYPFGIIFIFYFLEQNERMRNSSKESCFTSKRDLGSIIYLISIENLIFSNLIKFKYYLNILVKSYKCQPILDTNVFIKDFKKFPHRGSLPVFALHTFRDIK